MKFVIQCFGLVFFFYTFQVIKESLLAVRLVHDGSIPCYVHLNRYKDLAGRSVVSRYNLAAS